MAEQQGKDLMEIVYEMNSRLVRIEERLTRFDKIEDKADQAQITANKALALAEEVQRDVGSIRTGNLWAWGFIITLGIGMILQLVK